MSLTTRLLAYFLGALAVVLGGFSTSLYVLARIHLANQVDERLHAALDNLDAAAEREVDGLEWEPTERVVAVGRDTSPEAVCWEVRDLRHALVARSLNLGNVELGLPRPAEDETANEGGEWMDRHGERWQFAWRRVFHTGPSLPEVLPPNRYRVMVLAVGMSLEPMHATLRGLAVTLVGLSIGVFSVAALGGRWICRRALAPVTQMAAAARAMQPDDLSRRLPGPATHDELADLHLAFNNLLDRLQEAFERQRRFTGDASHQLRTPLAAMLGQVEVALRRDRAPEDYRQILKLVHDRTEHLRQITEALLFLARANADAELARLQPMDLCQWLLDHVQTWKDHARAGDLRLECCAGCIVRAQPVLLAQLIDNLLDNAFKYSESGTPVTITVRRDDAFIALTVEDAGLGITPKDLPHIFEAFYRSAEARRLGKSGVGLGLAMAQRIAAACGGNVTVSSEVGQGSRFTVRLPAAPGLAI